MAREWDLFPYQAVSIRTELLAPCVRCSHRVRYQRREGVKRHAAVGGRAKGHARAGGITS